MKWIVVLMSGMLNTADGLPAGYSEMSDQSEFGQFETKAECEKARPVIEEFVAGKMEAHFGADNIIYVTRCWKPLDPPA